MEIKMKKIASATFIALAGLSTSAFAQAPADFYKGKNVDMVIGFSVGGGYDVYARTVARFMGEHIPGKPRIVPKNMTGEGLS
jgi:tripartite-type tricarboxylate transporter receptor subunit TctC